MSTRFHLEGIPTITPAQGEPNWQTPPNTQGEGTLPRETPDIRPPWLQGGPPQLLQQRPFDQEATLRLFQHFSDTIPPIGVQIPTTQPPPQPTTQPIAQPAVPPDPVNDLSIRLARSIGTYETNAGGDHPIARESSLQTVAGVPASVRSVSQATMPWILQALTNHADLRQNTDHPGQPVTEEQIRQARQRVGATDQLLSSVSHTHENAQDFGAHNAALMQRGGFNQQDVERMFRGRELENTIRTAHSNIPYANIHNLTAAQRREQDAAINQSIGNIPETDRLGIAPGSLRAYIRNPSNWGENRAAWERLSVSRMDNGVGERIINTATHNDGVTMMGAVVRGQVSHQEQLHPNDQDGVIRGVAATHNARRDYPDAVLRTYHRLYPSEAPQHSAAQPQGNPQHPAEQTQGNPHHHAGRRPHQRVPHP